MSTFRKVLIIGASGFTGRHLSSLLSRDASVDLFLADRTALPTPPKRFTLCDCLDAAAVLALMERIRPDRVYHLVGSYTNDYDTDYASNVLTTKNILDALGAAKLSCRVLLVGSSAEYGFPLDPAKGVSENHSLRPVSLYGLVKTYQNALMGAYIRLYHIDIVSVRPFNLSGKGVSPVLFAGKMQQEIQRYKRGEIQEISTGNLSVERDYIDIEEAIKYYSVVMEKGVTGEIYNVGSGKSIPLRDLLGRMLTSERIPLYIIREGVHEVPGKIVVPKIYADITKIKKLQS